MLSPVLMRPGCSSFLGAIYLLYDYDQITDFYKGALTNYPEPQKGETVCSVNGTRRLMDGLLLRDPQLINVYHMNVAINAALTTNRYRKGNNRFYVCVSRPWIVGQDKPGTQKSWTFEFELEKLDERFHTTFFNEAGILGHRMKEEQVVTEVALSLAHNGLSEIARIKTLFPCITKILDHGLCTHTLKGKA